MILCVYNLVLYGRDLHSWLTAWVKWVWPEGKLPRTYLPRCILFPSGALGFLAFSATALAYSSRTPLLSFPIEASPAQGSIASDNKAAN